MKLERCQHEAEPTTTGWISKIIDIASEKRAPSLSRFSGAYVMLSEDSGSIEPIDNVKLTDLEWLNTSVCGLSDVGLLFARGRHIAPTDLRGMCVDKSAFLAKKLIRLDVTLMRRADHGSITMIWSVAGDTKKLVSYELDGSKKSWERAARDPLYRQSIEGKSESLFQDCGSLVFEYDFTREYCWSVRFDAGGLPVSILTDAIGVRRALELRDVPDGRVRRDALVHWVSAHSRKTRNDPDSETWVRRHLRGKWTCTIAGLNAQIAAPPDDIRDMTIERVR